MSTAALIADRPETRPEVRLAGCFHHSTRSAELGSCGTSTAATVQKSATANSAEAPAATLRAAVLGASSTRVGGALAVAVIAVSSVVGYVVPSVRALPAAYDRAGTRLRISADPECT